MLAAAGVIGRIGRMKQQPIRTAGLSKQCGQRFGKAQRKASRGVILYPSTRRRIDKFVHGKDERILTDLHQLTRCGVLWLLWLLLFRVLYLLLLCLSLTPFLTFGLA